MLSKHLVFAGLLNIIQETSRGTLQLYVCFKYIDKILQKVHEYISMSFCFKITKLKSYFSIVGILQLKTLSGT